LIEGYRKVSLFLFLKIHFLLKQKGLFLRSFKR
jgi:hypothetical protein